MLLCLVELSYFAVLTSLSSTCYIKAILLSLNCRCEREARTLPARSLELQSMNRPSSCISGLHNGLDHFDHFLRHAQHGHVTGFTLVYLAANLLGHLALHWCGYQLIPFAHQIGTGDLSPAAVRDLAVPSLSRLRFELFRPFVLLSRRQVLEK